MSDVELPDAFREEIQKARKAYFCCDCGDLIRPGQEYAHIAGCWDGVWDHFKVCLFCREIAKSLKEIHVFGQLEDALAHEIEDRGHPIAQRWIAHTGRDLWKKEESNV